jgi:hypothetical protein
MSDHTTQRRQMRLLAVVLVVLWAATAIAVAAAYRPGGPIDIIVVLACFLPVLVAAIGLEWPPNAERHRHRVALVWIWFAAVLLAIPVLYGVASTLAGGGPQNLVPSFEAAYAGLLAMFSMSFFSVIGFVHQRRGAVVFERTSTLWTAGLALLLSFAIAGAFGLVALINDQDLRREEPLASRYGPVDPDLVPPLCDEPVTLGTNATITIEAQSSEDDRPRGTARLDGQRGGLDEVWGGSWWGPDGTGEAAYLRVGQLAWLNEDSDDPEAPGTTWRDVAPGLFGLADPAALTMDGPPHAIVSGPRGSIVPEDLGLEVLEGARARHCRTFINGSTALATFLPLRWLLHDDVATLSSGLDDWRGELDWWVFGDGELGAASVEVSGRRANTPWDSDGVRALLEAELSAVHRSRPVDVSAPVAEPVAASSVVLGEASRSTAAEAALESAAP